MRTLRIAVVADTERAFGEAGELRQAVELRAIAYRAYAGSAAGPGPNRQASRRASAWQSPQRDTGLRNG